MFKEDYPSMIENAVLSLFLMTGEWNVDPELIDPTYRTNGIGVFEVSGAHWVIETSTEELPQNDVMDINPDTLKNYDVPLATAMGGTIEDLARARRMMDNIDPYADLNPEAFQKFNET